MTISNNFFRKNKEVLGKKTHRILKLLSFRDNKLLSRTVTGYKFSEILKGGEKVPALTLTK